MLMWDPNGSIALQAYLSMPVFSFLGGEVEDRFVIHENTKIPSYAVQPEIPK